MVQPFSRTNMNFENAAQFSVSSCALAVSYVVKLHHSTHPSSNVHTEYVNLHCWFKKSERILWWCTSVPVDPISCMCVELASGDGQRQWGNLVASALGSETQRQEHFKGHMRTPSIMFHTWNSLLKVNAQFSSGWGWRGRNHHCYLLVI